MALLAMPLIQTIEEFSNAVNIPSFIITYIIIPVAMNYSEAVDAIKSAREKTKEAMSLTFSEVRFSFMITDFESSTYAQKM